MNRPESPRLSSRFMLRSVAVLVGAMLAGCSAGMSGVYEEVGGEDIIEFRAGGAVYMSAFGTTVAGTYEVDGEHIIITLPDGSIVLTREGDMLENGPLGETYQKR